MLYNEHATVACSLFLFYSHLFEKRGLKDYQQNPNSIVIQVISSSPAIKAVKQLQIQIVSGGETFNLITLKLKKLRLKSNITLDNLLNGIRLWKSVAIMPSKLSSFDWSNEFHGPISLPFSPVDSTDCSFCVCTFQF